jgi:hypothetical protein
MKYKPCNAVAIPMQNKWLLNRDLLIKKGMESQILAEDQLHIEYALYGERDRDTSVQANYNVAFINSSM